MFTVRDVAAAGGGAIVVGSVRGATFGIEPPPDIDSGVVMALGDGGQVIWSQVVHSEQPSDIARVAISGQAIAVASHLRGGAQLGTASLAARGEPGAVVSVLEADGTSRWHSAIFADGYSVVTALTWTDKGELIAGGYYGGSLLGPPRLSSGGSLDAWVAAFDGSTGSLRWMHRAGGPGADTVHDLLAHDGQVFVCGSFHAWADFGSTRLEDGRGGGAGYVARVGPGGWAGAMTTVAGSSAVARSLARSGAGIAVAVQSEGNLGGLEGIGGASSISVVQLTTELAPSWSIRLGGAEPTGLAALVALGDELAVVGDVQGTIDISGLGNFAARHGRDSFVARLSTDGRALSAHLISAGHGDEIALAAAATADRSVVIAGQLDGQYAIGSAHGQSGATSDAFVIRTRPND